MILLHHLNPNEQWLSLFANIHLSFLSALSCRSPSGRISPSSLPRGLCDFSSHFIYSVTLIFLHPFHVCAMTMKKRKENGPAGSKAVPRCAVESDGLRSELIPPGGPLSCVWGPSRWIHSLALHFSGGQQKKSCWKKIGMSVASLGGFAGILCTPGEAEEEGWASLHFISLWGWQARNKHWAQDQADHSILTRPVFTLVAVNWMICPYFLFSHYWTDGHSSQQSLHFWNKAPATGWVLFSDNQHSLAVLPFKPIQTDKTLQC